jgi:predicted dehydrogenase
MAVAYAVVLQAMGIPFDVLGRGENSAARFAQATGIRPSVGGLEHFCADRNLAHYNAAIIAVSVPNLANATTCLIDAGVPKLLVEKPAGIDVQEIERVSAEARRRGTAVFVGYNRRYLASVSAARELIAVDGGVTSFHLEFTELADNVSTAAKNQPILASWFLANSSHLIDLAFYLGGAPSSMTGFVGGNLPWHPAGSIFVGHGRSEGGALFSWHANWESGGRWSLDLRTARRRLLLQPLETLQVQEKGELAIRQMEVDATYDKKYKAGLYRQVEDFLAADAAHGRLPTIREHAAAVRNSFLPILTG